MRFANAENEAAKYDKVAKYNEVAKYVAFAARQRTLGKVDYIQTDGNIIIAILKKTSAETL